MNKKIARITIKNDDEGMFGAEGTDRVDVDATIERYEQDLVRAFKREMPNVIIEHQYGPYSGRSIRIESLDGNDHDDLSEDVSDIVWRVYSTGSFWVTK